MRLLCIVANASQELGCVVAGLSPWADLAFKRSDDIVGDKSRTCRMMSFTGAPDELFQAMAFASIPGFGSARFPDDQMGR
jgi:hypothetical protein